MAVIEKAQVVDSATPAVASVWRLEPYLLFFPAGIVLSWAGVLHWLLHALGVLEDYRPIFHAMTQVQGFLICFAMGFLFTMLPRRTESDPPALWQLAIGVMAPIATVLAAWYERWIVSQMAWLLLAGVLMAFVLPRTVGRGGRRRPPNGFVWIPMALFMGITGSVLTGLPSWLGESYAWLHEVGKGLVLHGMFVGLVLGVGSLALPLMMRGEAPPDGGASRRDSLIRWAHIAGGLVLFGSFWVMALVSLRLGMLLRALVIVAVLSTTAQSWRRPRPVAWNARLLWLASWLIPAGYLFAAAFPLQFRAGIHQTFIGGFALLVLSVSTQVVLGHGGFRDLMLGRPWQVLVVGSAVLLAMVSRILMELDAARFFLWMGTAASFFLLATGVWASFLVPKMLQRVSAERSGVEA